MDHTALLKGWALEEGFTRVGVATLEPSEHGPYLRRWLELGDHAEMSWLAQRTEIREDPAKLLPGARSVLCVALQYWPLEGQEEPTGDLWPRVARYARGRDYHDVMGRALKRLARRISEAFPEAQTRPYVDTGPILERELAARAGLGSFGKNTNLLDRDWGSYFLLGELLLTMDLEPDVPSPEDVCGQCTRCLDACPTGALAEAYRLDARRCISYWTIEHRGDLPESSRRMNEDWVFGCDICQEVCPYNHPTSQRDRPRPGTEERLRLPAVREELDLAGLLRLDREGYVERFQVSAMKRAKLPGLRRNAAVAMGNRRQEKYVPALVKVVLQPAEDEVVRRHAVWALGRIGSASAVAALEEALDGADPVLQAEIEAALGARRDAESG